MCKRLSVFGFVAVAFLLMCSPSWATCGSPVPDEGGGLSITCHYTPSVTSNTFSYPNSNSLRIEFRAVLRPFDLTITRRLISTTAFAARLDAKFPEGSTCYHYAGTTATTCAVYDATGPLPAKGTDYGGPVTWQLTYLDGDLGGDPGLAHAKATSTQYTENILQFYFTPPPSSVTLSPSLSSSPVSDPSMQGDSGGLSSVAAVKQPAGNDCFSWVSPQEGQTFTVGAEVEVAFQVFASTSCTGTPIRDQDARLSVARIVGGQPVFVPLGTAGSRFHFNNEDKVNEQEFETEGLPPGEYVITVFSNKFPPKSRAIRLI